MKSSDNAEVVFCDNHLLVAVKPAGLLTQPTPENLTSLEGFAKAWLQREYQKPGNVFLHCIHRLDRLVSGLVLFARTSKALSRLNEQSRVQEIQRIYIGEVEGILSPKLGQLDHYLIHADHRAVIAKEGEGKHARLTYEVLHYMPHSTLVRIELETGRYHQIRAQFSAAGHPIAGDQRYGARPLQSDEIRLHCTKLAFEHPVTKELLSFESPPPFS